MSLGVTTFDQMNRLVGMERSIPLESYFAPMVLSAEKKRERLRLAKGLEEEFVYCMAYMFYAYPNINESMVKEFRDRYINQLMLLGIASAAATEQAEKFAIEVVDSTLNHREDPYYYSKDRARLCAEDQACFQGDIGDYAEAVESGMRFKTWETVGDNRVRESHAEVEGLTIGIDDVFVLQGGLLKFPHDTSLGISDDEVCGCRCTLSYSYGE